MHTCFAFVKFSILTGTDDRQPLFLQGFFVYIILFRLPNKLSNFAGFSAILKIVDEIDTVNDI